MVQDTLSPPLCNSGQIRPGGVPECWTPLGTASVVPLLRFMHLYVRADLNQSDLGPKGKLYKGWWFGEMIPSSPSSLTKAANKCPATPPSPMPNSTSVTIPMSLGMMVLFLLLGVASTPIPISGGEPPALGITPETALLHILPLSISLNEPWPTSHSTSPSTISVCGT